MLSCDFCNKTFKAKHVDTKLPVKGFKTLIKNPSYKYINKKGEIKVGEPLGFRWCKLLEKIEKFFVDNHQIL